jgi:hypothetical protein
MADAVAGPEACPLSVFQGAGVAVAREARALLRQTFNFGLQTAARPPPSFVPGRKPKRKVKENPRKT